MPILFDLDGTLVDPRVGIIASLRHALHELGAKIPPTDALESAIGPPIHAAMASLLDTSDESRIASGVSAYREEFARVGVSGNAVYPGVVGALERLRHEGHTLFVATSKSRGFAVQIVQAHGLSDHFHATYGSELDGTRSDKGDLIGHLLERERIAPHTCIMVGDRRHDIVGARASGVFAVGVSWGFGSRTELQACGADRIIDDPSELPLLLAGAL